MSEIPASGAMPSFNRRQALSLSLVSSLAWLSFAALPYELSFITRISNISDGAAAYFASAELISLACSASWFGRSIAGWDKRFLTMVGLAIAGLANVSCLLFDHVALFFLARLFAGAGLGMVAAATNALPALQPRPEKVFAHMAIGMSVVFAVLMYAIPIGAEWFGNRGLFVVELVFIGVIGSLSVYLPRAVALNAGKTRASTGSLPEGSLNTLYGLGIMQVGQGACWAFAERAGEAQHFSGVELGAIFTISALVSLAGAFGATALGLRLGYRLPLYIGYALQVLIAIGIYCVSSRYLYIAAVVATNAAGTFTIPYVQGILAELDTTGRAAALSGAAINFGAAAGPAVAAALMIIPGLVPVGICSIFMAVVSIGFVALGGRRIIFR